MKTRIYKTVGVSLFSLAAMSLNQDYQEGSRLQQEYLSRCKTVTPEVREKSLEYMRERSSNNGGESLVRLGLLLTGAYLAVGPRKEEKSLE